MKIKEILKGSLLTASLMLSPLVNAMLLTEVGGVDEFISSATLKNSGDATELTWAKQLLADPIVLDDKYDSSGNDWTLVDGQSDVYFTEFTNNPAYYLLKFGTGKSGVDSHFLFKNSGNEKFAVIDFSQAGIDLLTVKKFHIGKISHVTEFDNISVASVPAPTGFVFLLMALFGSIVVRKKSNR
ncbi:hypothetical protein [Psychromonas hadalis]|uniref:hypothetical protein n=1 Tax=Psychromonas hadalis TaxID=211669 RepID=UPI0003B30FE5|nr:hypothetical protein [Psychromonas hadalis]